MTHPYRLVLTVGIAIGLCVWGGVSSRGCNLLDLDFEAKRQRELSNEDEYPNPGQSFGGGNEMSGGDDIDDAGNSRGELVYGWESPMNDFTGYFQSLPHDGGESSCRFFFHGRMKGKHPKIAAWVPSQIEVPDVITGTYNEEGSGLVIALSREPEGCAGDRRFADPEHPAKFKVTESGWWVGVRLVSAPRVYFYDEPNPEKRSENYVVRDTAVLVERKHGLKVVPGWFYALDRRNENLRAGDPGYPAGWLREYDVYPAIPPGTDAGTP